MKYWEIIADNLSKAGWSWGLCRSRGCREETGQQTARDQELHGDLIWRGEHESARCPITASPHRRLLAVCCQRFPFIIFYEMRKSPDRLEKS
jgi:hypothetical protein